MAENMTIGQVFLDHLDAVGAGDFERLLGGYAKDAVIITPQQTYMGRQGVADFYRTALTAYPNLKLTLDDYKAHGDMLLAMWNGDSDVARIEAGVDTFVIRDNEILQQTIWFVPVPK